MIKRLFFLVMMGWLWACESQNIEDIIVKENLMVIESWLTDELKIQTIRITQSSAFTSKESIYLVDNAEVTIHDNTGLSHPFEYTKEGFYESLNEFAGQKESSYRLSIQLFNGDLIQSKWQTMPQKTEIIQLSVESFIDNTQLENVLYYPKIFVVDNEETTNFYRWKFYQGKNRYEQQNPIIIQNDLFFNGNFIPNTFDEFFYQERDTMIVELQSITSEAYDFLNTLRINLNTLTPIGNLTTFVPVSSNLTNSNNPQQEILGFFSCISISRDTIFL